MKDALRSFVSFTRAERFGLAALSVLVLLLLLLRVMLSFRPVNREPSLDKKMQLAWNRYAKDTVSQKAAPPIPVNKISGPVYWDREGEQLPDFININVADSATFENMKGIGPAFAHKIMEYRRKNGRFRQVATLFELQPVPEATIKLLLPHLKLKDSL